MRKFVDLHIIPGASKVDSMLNQAVKLGFSAIGVSGPKPKADNIDTVSRLDITPKNQEQLNNMLRNSRRKFEVISVICQNKNVARQAAKDNRVDIIKFPLDQKKRRSVWLDHHQANLMKESGCSYEIDIRDLLIHDASTMENRLRRISRETHIASKADIPIIASSGAHKALEMREPKAIASILNLIEVDYEEALNMVSENPYSIIIKNRSKLSKSYIMPGVWLNEDPP